MLKNLIVICAACALVFTGLLYYADFTWLPDMPLPRLLDRECAFDREEVIESQRIIETEHVRSFINYKPIAQGAILILPKRHVERLEDLTAEEWSEMHEMIKHFKEKFKEAYGTEDYVLVVQTGYYGGQTVPHAHLHMIPRGKESTMMKKLQLWNLVMTDYMGNRHPLTPEQTQQTIEKLK